MLLALSLSKAHEETSDKTQTESSFPLWPQKILGIAFPFKRWACFSFLTDIFLPKLTASDFYIWSTLNRIKNNRCTFGNRSNPEIQKAASEQHLTEELKKKKKNLNQFRNQDFFCFSLLCFPFPFMFKEESCLRFQMPNGSEVCIRCNHRKAALRRVLRVCVIHVVLSPRQDQLL